MGVSDEEGAEGVDKAYGGKGKDTILGSNDADFLLIFGGPDDDALGAAGEGGGGIYGGSGNDQIGKAVMEKMTFSEIKEMTC